MGTGEARMVMGATGKAGGKIDPLFPCSVYSVCSVVCHFPFKDETPRNPAMARLSIEIPTARPVGGPCSDG